MEPITRTTAIRTFFNMTTQEAMREIPELKKADADGYEWVAQQCAAQLGTTLKAIKA